VGNLITVGLSDFIKSILLAAKSFLPNLGTCELVDTALVNELAQLVPDMGSAQDFIGVHCARQALMSGRHGVP
jgi:hypothetical protein